MYVSYETGVHRFSFNSTELVIGMLGRGSLIRMFVEHSLFTCEYGASFKTEGTKGPPKLNMVEN